MANKWSKEELKLLKEKYPKSSKDELVQLFPKRTFESIQLKANRMKVRKEYSVDGNEWREDEVSILKEHFALSTNNELTKYLPGRSIRSIQAKAERLGLRKKNRKNREDWSYEDNKLFIKYYPIMTTKDLIRTHFPNKTKKQIDDKAYRLNLYKTDETKEEARKQQGEMLSAKFKGREFSPETIKKMSQSAIERFKTQPHPSLGIKRSMETRFKISKNKKELGQWKGNRNPRHHHPLIGEENGRWEGGITAENLKVRNSKEYAEWRSNVFARDNYTCQVCGVKHDNIQAHHIENFADNPDKRFDNDNGITICKEHHCPTIKGSFHNIYGIKNNNREQLLEYIEQFNNGNFGIRKEGVV